MPEMDWGQILTIVGVLVVGWVILKTVLKLTMKVFTLGLAALIACAVIGLLVNNFR